MTVTESTRTHELAAFYAEHHRRVLRGVSARAGGTDDEMIHDACAFAWLMLVRRDDVRFDRRGVAWLIVVGARRAWELARLARRERPVGGFLSVADPGELVEPAGLASEPVDRLIALEDHAERLRRFQRPSPRERRDLFLQAAGYRYAEIVELTGSTYTAVNRRLTEGRRRLYARDAPVSGGEHRAPST